MNDVDCGPLLEHFADHVRRRAVARRSEVDLAGVGLGVGNELGDRVHRQLRIGDQEIGAGREQCDRREILDRVIADVGVDRGSDREGRGVAEHQRIAVGFGACGRFGADGAARPGTIVDDDALIKTDRQLLGGEACHGVGRPAGGERHDHLDDAARVGLRIGAAGEGGGRCNGTGEPRATADHGVLSRPVVQTVVLVGRLRRS